MVPNILANPQFVSFEVGPDTKRAVARIPDGMQREHLRSAQKSEFPMFAEYGRRASPRQIPVVVPEHNDVPCHPHRTRTTGCR